jgi:hypothetical protein
MYISKMDTIKAILANYFLDILCNFAVVLIEK